MTFSYSVARTGSHPPEMKGIPIYLPFSSLPSSFFLRHHPSLPQSSFSLCPSFPPLSFLPVYPSSTPALIYATVYKGFCHLAWKKRDTRIRGRDRGHYISIPVKYYTHTPLFPPLFQNFADRFQPSYRFLLHPPRRAHIRVPLPFARDRFCSYPSPPPPPPPKMAKEGGWRSRIFRFSPERNAFIGTSIGYKVYFRALPFPPLRESRFFDTQHSNLTVAKLTSIHP